MFARPCCPVQPFYQGNGSILSVGAHIGAPLRRRGSVALLFTYMANRSCLFCAETFDCAKAFSRGEGGTLPVMAAVIIQAVRNRCGFVSLKLRRQCDGRGQAKHFLNRTVSKRTGSLALFRHGTAKLVENLVFDSLQNAAIQKMHCAGAAPPSPRGKAFAH